MRYRKQTSSGDYTFGGGLADFYIDIADAVGQAVLTRLKLWAGEWFLDVSEGTPYQGGVLGKYTKDTVDPVIRERILGTKGVTAITEFSSGFNPDDRTYFINAAIDTIYGPTTVTGIL